MLNQLKDPKFQQFLREQKGHIYNAAWGAGLLLTLMQSIGYASFNGRLLLLPMLPLMGANFLNVMTTPRSRDLYQQIKIHTKTANLAFGVLLILLMAFADFESLHLSISMFLSIMCFFDVLKYTTNNYLKQGEDSFPSKIFDRNPRALVLAGVGLFYIIILPFNVYHSAFWRIFEVAFGVANLLPWASEIEKMIYYGNIAWVGLVLCAGILVGPSSMMFPGFIGWSVVVGALGALERLVLSKQPKHHEVTGDKKKY
eukprot:TRINITY_DN15496_c0_g1_i1.p1 TRINITY_DN15496_c0_g1~~TRINITY_DN15496_c0_g1_i1.p1  ORF type:complete len:256 (-),score=55.16 TRINITY_DN15496_c0_g1_i1:18-785(-)